MSLTQKRPEYIHNVILLVKMDSQNLFARIEKRKREYLNEFSLKRTRDHFRDIFLTRYYSIEISDLKYFGTETLLTLDHFYQDVDQLKWYLYHTQDMAQMMNDKVDGFIRSIRGHFDMLNLYLDADLEVYNDETQLNSASKQVDSSEKVIDENFDSHSEMQLGADFKPAEEQFMEIDDFQSEITFNDELKEEHTDLLKNKNE